MFTPYIFMALLIKPQGQLFLDLCTCFSYVIYSVLQVDYFHLVITLTLYIVECGQLGGDAV
jgi:hypothetical protein